MFYDLKGLISEIENGKPTSDIVKERLEYLSSKDYQSEMLISEIKTPEDLLDFGKITHKGVHGQKITYISEREKKKCDKPLRDETLGIISLLWRDYICSPEEKQRLKEQDVKVKISEENKLNEKYNYDDLFNKKRNRSEKIKEPENFALVDKKETILIEL